MNSNNATTSSSTTSGTGASNAGEGAGNALKQGWAKFHGLGEAIRGNVNTFADNATGTDDTRSKAELNKGEQEFKSGVPSKYDSTGATLDDSHALNSRN